MGTKLNSDPKPRKQLRMNEHAKAFNQRLIGIFETKEAEFTKHSEEHPATAPVTVQIAGLYSDLIEIMRH